MIDVLRFIIFLFFPFGAFFLAAAIVTWDTDRIRKYHYPIYYNPFFIIWIVQAVIWFLLIKYVQASMVELEYTQRLNRCAFNCLRVRVSLLAPSNTFLIQQTCKIVRARVTQIVETDSNTHYQDQITKCLLCFMG